MSLIIHCSLPIFPILRFSPNSWTTPQLPRDFVESFYSSWHFTSHLFPKPPPWITELLALLESIKRSVCWNGLHLHHAMWKVCNGFYQFRYTPPSHSWSVDCWIKWMQSLLLWAVGCWGQILGHGIEWSIFDLACIEFYGILAKCKRWSYRKHHTSFSAVDPMLPSCRSTAIFIN